MQSISFKVFQTTGIKIVREPFSMCLCLAGVKAKVVTLKHMSMLMTDPFFIVPTHDQTLSKVHQYSLLDTCQHGASDN